MPSVIDPVNHVVCNNTKLRNRSSKVRNHVPVTARIRKALEIDIYIKQESIQLLGRYN